MIIPIILTIFYITIFNVLAAKYIMGLIYFAFCIPAIGSIIVGLPFLPFIKLNQIIQYFQFSINALKVSGYFLFWIIIGIINIMLISKGIEKIKECHMAKNEEINWGTILNTIWLLSFLITYIVLATVP